MATPYSAPGLRYPISHECGGQRYIVDELDGLRCTVSELLDLSPERSKQEATLFHTKLDWCVFLFQIFTRVGCLGWIRIGDEIQNAIII